MRVEGPYTLISKLGEGGMAEVFKAIKKGPDGFEKAVALKRILPFFADHKEFIQMLSAEARLHAQLDHPNLVQVVDFFQVDENYIIAQEYIHGRNLRQIVKEAARKRISLPWQAAVHIICEALQGLYFAHKKEGPKGPLKIVHRDMSPQNILVSFEGFVKVTDFGIAWAENNRVKTQSGVLKGKFRYLSPEQIQAKELDFRSDLFSIGIVFYELICGQHPFNSGNDFEIMKKIERTQYQGSEELREDIPDLIHIAIRKCLEQDPSKRPSDAKELRDMLLLAQDPLWLSRETHKLASWLGKLYPKNEQDIEDTIVPTPVLSAGNSNSQIHVTTSLISKHSSPGVEFHPRRTKSLLGFFLLLTFGFGAWYFYNRFSDSDFALRDFAKPALMPSKKNSTAETYLPNATPKRDFGHIKVQGPNESKVFVNGQIIGHLPMKNYRLRVGKYLILIKPKQGKNFMSRVAVQSERITSIRWDPKD